METVAALEHPWSLWDPKQPTLKQDGTPHVPAGGAGILATDTEAELRGLSKSAALRRGPQRHSADGRPWRLWFLGAPLRTGEPARLELRGPNGRTEISIEQPGSVARPIPQQHASDAALSLDILVGTQVERLDNAIAKGKQRTTVTGAMPGLVRPAWHDLDSTVLADENPDEPFMALIVRHADTMRQPLRTVTSNPRRVLRRQREEERVQRIRELDPACLRDYVRRPGITPAEKAGARQTLLGVVRRETYNTLENRVLKDFMARSRAEARAYLHANRNLNGSERHKSVRRYHTLLKRLLSDPNLEDVDGISGVPSPNYVLQHDRRYSTLWVEYLRLVKRQEVLDEAWTWQRRLWSDTASLMLLAAPAADPQLQVKRSTLPYLRTEQDHGRWLDPTLMERTFITSDEDPWALIVRREEEHDGPTRHPWHDLNPTVRMEAVHLTTGQQKTALAWAIHGVTDQPTDAALACESANRTIHAWNNKSNSQIDAAVLLVPADVTHDQPTTHTAGVATAIQVPLAGRGIAMGMESIMSWARATLLRDTP